MSNQYIFDGHHPVLVKVVGEDLQDVHMPGHALYEQLVEQIRTLARELEIAFEEAAAMYGFEVGTLAEFVVK